MANSVKNNHFLYRLLRNFEFAEKKSNVMYIFSILALKAEYLSALNVKFYHFFHLHSSQSKVFSNRLLSVLL